MIPADWIVYATDASEEGKAECKAWCKDHGLTPEDVRIIIREGTQCLAITKRKVTL
jgi:hypothetical protein